MGILNKKTILKFTTKPFSKSFNKKFKETYEFCANFKDQDKLKAYSAINLHFSPYKYLLNSDNKSRFNEIQAWVKKESLKMPSGRNVDILSRSDFSIETIALKTDIEEFKKLLEEFKETDIEQLKISVYNHLLYFILDQLLQICQYFDRKINRYVDTLFGAIGTNNKTIYYELAEKTKLSDSVEDLKRCILLIDNQYEFLKETESIDNAIDENAGVVFENTQNDKSREISDLDNKIGKFLSNIKHFMEIIKNKSIYENIFNIKFEMMRYFNNNKDLKGFEYGDTHLLAQIKEIINNFESQLSDLLMKLNDLRLKEFNPPELQPINSLIDQIDYLNSEIETSNIITKFNANYWNLEGFIFEYQYKLSELTQTDDIFHILKDFNDLRERKMKFNEIQNYMNSNKTNETSEIINDYNQLYSYIENFEAQIEDRLIKLIENYNNFLVQNCRPGSAISFDWLSMQVNIPIESLRRLYLETTLKDALLGEFSQEINKIIMDLPDQPSFSTENYSDYDLAILRQKRTESFNRLGEFLWIDEALKFFMFKKRSELKNFLNNYSDRIELWDDRIINKK